MDWELCFDLLRDERVGSAAVLCPGYPPAALRSRDLGDLGAACGGAATVRRRGCEGGDGDPRSRQGRRETDRGAAGGAWG